MSNMYSEVKPWNCFVGCRFDCVYCKPSFQAQAKRQKHNCMKCYSFEPHEHLERIWKIPKGEIVWPVSSGDISFADTTLFSVLISPITAHREKTFYLQSKNPACFKSQLHKFIGLKNLILLTTLETNRDMDYRKISKAPYPTDRAFDFMRISWPRKIVTIEPIMDFDHDEFLKMILDIKPEAVYLGYNSRPKSVKLPEPSHDKAFSFITCLEEAGIPVKTKYIPWESHE
jgi:hypothetical protein